MNLDFTMILTILVGTVLPVFNGLITKAQSSVLRTYLQIVLNAVAGFAIELLDHLVTGAQYDVRQAALAAGMALVVALTTQAGVWKPLGVSDWAKNHGNTPAQHRLTDDY